MNDTIIRDFIWTKCIPDWKICHLMISFRNIYRNSMTLVKIISLKISWRWITQRFWMNWNILAIDWFLSTGPNLRKVLTFLKIAWVEFINLSWLISEVWARPSYGKLIQNRAFSRKIIFKEFGGVILPHRPIFYQNWIGSHKKLMDKFSRNRSILCPWKLKFREIFWLSFPALVNRDEHCQRISQWLLFKKSKTEFFRIKMNLISLMVDLSKIREQKCFAYAKSLVKLQWNSISGKMHFVCPTSEASPSGKQWGWFSNSILLFAEFLGGKFENRY